jgi:transcriptional regulator with XRE-family HTH domain
MPSPKVTEFRDVLAAAMAKAGLSAGLLSGRLGISTQQVHKWLAGKPVSAERQAEILHACRAPAADIAALVADFERDVAARLVDLRHDLETLIAPKRASQSSANEAVSIALPTRKRQRP